MTYTPHHGPWSPSAGVVSTRRPGLPDTADMPSAWLKQHQFHTMRRRLQPHGGLWEGRKLQRRLGLCGALDALCADGVLLDFTWLGRRWMPGFQFDATNGCLHMDLLPVYAELPGSYDAWATVRWFAEPNALLGGQLPVARLAHDQPSVVAAARAEHFLVDV